MYVDGRWQAIGNVFSSSTNTSSSNVERGLDGTITIKPRSGLFGSNLGDDRVSVENLGNGFYGVTVNGERLTFSREEMTRLKIDTGGGSDSIAIGPGVDVPLGVDAGFGDDVVVNQSNGVSVDGGPGNDRIESYGNGNMLYGGGGNDLIRGVGSFNRAAGGPGWDRVGILGFANASSVDELPRIVVRRSDMNNPWGSIEPIADRPWQLDPWNGIIR